MLKKNLLILFFTAIVGLIPIKADALSVKIVPSGSTIVSPTMLTQLFTVTYDLGINLFFSMTPKDDYLVSALDSSIKIPITNMYLKGDGNKIQCQKGVAMTLFNKALAPGSETVTGTVENVGPAPAGIYKASFDIGIQVSGISISSSTLLTFNIPNDLDVDSTTGPASISFDEDAVLDTSTTVKNTTNTVLNIRSNRKWRLYLNTNSIGTLPSSSYYFLIKSATGSSITNWNQTTTELLPNQRYLLAEGTYTMTSLPTSSYISTYLTIEYSYKNTTGQYITEGTRNNNLLYELEAQN